MPRRWGCFWVRFTDWWGPNKTRGFCFVWLVGFLLTPSSATRLYPGRVPRLTSGNLNVLPLTRQSGETMVSVSAGHIILTPTQPVGSGRPQRGPNPGPPHQESRALPTELPPPPPPPPKKKKKKKKRAAENRQNVNLRYFCKLRDTTDR